MEPDGIYNNRLKDLTRVEGTYQFRAVATYGEGCRATREAHWAVHVEPAIDPGRSGVTLVDVNDRPDGRYGTIVIVPQDPYGNPIGPGRGGLFTVTPIPGVQIVGPVRDDGKGGYEIPVSWEPGKVAEPGVLVQQPERNPVIITPTATGQPPCPPRDCRGVAGDLLSCLGLPDAHVKRVRVKRVSLELDLDSREECCDDTDSKPKPAGHPGRPCR
jgi:hypothetical protein